MIVTGRVGITHSFISMLAPLVLGWREAETPLRAVHLPLNLTLRVLEGKRKVCGRIWTIRWSRWGGEAPAATFPLQSAQFPAAHVLWLGRERITTSASRQLGIKVLMVPPRQLGMEVILAPLAASTLTAWRRRLLQS